MYHPVAPAARGRPETDVNISRVNVDTRASPTAGTDIVTSNSGSVGT